jgi:dihydroorotate dehydrogenase electron transfer subunit
MIRKEIMLIQSSEQIASDTIEMVLANSYISRSARPGQFLHISIPGHMLRRPISIANADKDKGTVTILFKIAGNGTKGLASLQVGSKLDVLGPCGNGFPLEVSEDSTILLIGGGIGVPPLYYLGKELKKLGVKIVSILGFQSKDHVFYERKFRELGETYIVTNDGSYGERGFVTDVLSNIQNFDLYYSCGPIPMLQAITKALKDKTGYISLEERMGCGVGACYACVIPSKDEQGYKKICHDGPVFSSQEVIL